MRFRLRPAGQLVATPDLPLDTVAEGSRAMTAAVKTLLTA
jgi:hypothetical protein